MRDNPGAQFLEGRGILDVVKMLMGEKKVARGEGMLGEKSGHPGGRIDDDASAVFLSQEVAVGLEGSASVDEEVHERRASMAGAIASGGMVEQAIPLPRRLSKTKVFLPPENFLSRESFSRISSVEISSERVRGS